MKIDVFNHIFPKPFFERLQQVIVNKGAVKRWLNIPFLYDLDVRFRKLEEFGPEYRQILSLSAPPIESINPDRGITLDLAKLANDSMAGLVRDHRDRFPGFIASLPLSLPEESVAELERAVTQLGAVGVQLFSNVNGLPLDEPRFHPLFEAANRLRCPILLHPARGAGFADYASEQKSKYEIWWTFGWPYETSVAMQRLVFSRLFDRLPDIRIVAHHLGAMIPYFEGRIGYGLRLESSGLGFPESRGLAVWPFEMPKRLGWPHIPPRHASSSRPELRKAPAGRTSSYLPGPAVRHGRGAGSRYP